VFHAEKQKGNWGILSRCNSGLGVFADQKIIPNAICFTKSFRLITRPELFLTQAYRLLTKVYPARYSFVRRRGPSVRWL